MTLLTAAIIAPDTSHWADWIDAAIRPTSPKGQVARDLHQRLLEQGASRSSPGIIWRSCSS